MNRSSLRYPIIAAVLVMAGHGIVDAAGDEVSGRLESVNVARAGDNTLDREETADGAEQKGELSKASLSAEIALPMLDPNPVLPQVLLSEKHKKLCLKRVGDQLDNITIKDVTGRDVKLRDELSDRLTVLIFWSDRSVAGYEQFRRIPVDMLSKFAPHRVKVIAANVGGTVQETQRLTGKAANKILSLADTNSELFKQFAAGGVPRTYVLDADGRVLWFDLEYSESTRRSLDNALTYFIQQSSSRPQ